MMFFKKNRWLKWNNTIKVYSLKCTQQLEEDADINEDVENDDDDAAAVCFPFFVIC